MRLIAKRVSILSAAALAAAAITSPTLAQAQTSAENSAEASSGSSLPTAAQHLSGTYPHHTPTYDRQAEGPSPLPNSAEQLYEVGPNSTVVSPYGDASETTVQCLTFRGYVNGCMQELDDGSWQPLVLFDGNLNSDEQVLVYPFAQHPEPLLNDPALAAEFFTDPGWPRVLQSPWASSILTNQSAIGSSLAN